MTWNKITLRHRHGKRRLLPFPALFLRPLLVGVGVFILAGCGGSDEGNTPSPQDTPGVTLPAKLTFTMTNRTKKTLKNVMVEGFAINVKYTSLKSGGSRSLLGLKPMGMADKMTVSWADPKGGARISQPVKGKLPKSFNGMLYFTITSKGKVTFRAGTMSSG